MNRGPQPPAGSTPAVPGDDLHRWLEEGLRHHDAGRADEAEALYSRVLALDPHQPDALYLSGLLALQADNPARAAELFRQAIGAAPQRAVSHINLGVALAALGKSAEAAASYERALELQPDSPEALCNLANALLRLGRPDEAIARYEQAFVLAPALPQALVNLANILWQQRRLDEAVARCRQALAIIPDLPEALLILSNALRDQGKLEEAIACLRRAVSQKPDFPEAFCNLGNALRAQGQLQEASACYRHALALNPDFPEALANLGYVLQEQEHFAEALACCERALALQPDCAEAHYVLGISLESLGRIERARRELDEAVALQPGNTVYYFALGESRRLKPGDPHLLAMEALARDIESRPAKEAVPLYFALAKAYGDIGDHERSFQHLLAGNRHKRQEIAYDEANELGAYARIEAVFTSDLITRNEAVGDPSTLPIFIIGMPRSGTTLVEQILAAHKLVFAAGELTDLYKVVAALPASIGSGRELPELFAELTPAQLRRIGSDYVARLAVRAPWATRMTDKMPENFLLAGLIHLALPNARIIHLQRDPVDTCLSCFSKLFSDGHGYSYDLAELGRHYKAYARLMEHWRRVLPAGAMLELRYEELVTDFEAQARRLLDYCGLSWDPACLAFHETDRPVLTASSGQVRQPLYASSVGRAGPYRQMLQPLIDALR